MADSFKPAAGGPFVSAIHLRGRGFHDRVGGRRALDRPLAPISIGAWKQLMTNSLASLKPALEMLARLEYASHAVDGAGRKSRPCLSIQ